MNVKTTYITSALTLLLVFIATGNTLAAQNIKAKAMSASKSYVPKSLKKKGVNEKNIDKALEFLIPKSMAKKLNAIQWTLKAGKDGRRILSGNHYRLVNLAINRGLKRQKRTKAANLGFLKENSNKFNMLVQRQKGNGELRYGDVIALNLKPYGWLRYKKQGSWGGINLGDDDNKPHYIWKITGGRNGKKVVSGMPFALHNIKPIKREIIYCARASGIDLGWRGKSKCNSKLAKISNAAFGANGALSGEGLSGKLSKKWKNKLCKAAIGAASAYATAQTGGLGAAGVAAAGPKALKKCNSY